LGGIGMDRADRLAIGGIAAFEQRLVASDRIGIVDIDRRVLTR
jgi:hypothetical protein